MNSSKIATENQHHYFEASTNKSIIISYKVSLHGVLFIYCKQEPTTKLAQPTGTGSKVV